jgi:hypothetical protein
VPSRTIRALRWGKGNTETLPNHPEAPYEARGARTWSQILLGSVLVLGTTVVHGVATGAALVAAFIQRLAPERYGEHPDR